MGLLYEEESYLIIGAAIDVHKELGNGFLEAVYQECLEREFKLRGIPFVSQYNITILYKEIPLIQKYIADFICFDKIIIELKTVQKIAPEHKAQILNYLKATGFNLGLLVNFGAHPKVEILRMVNSNFSRFSRLSRLYQEEK